jgi:hypothetical protein
MDMAHSRNDDYVQIIEETHTQGTSEEHHGDWRF